MTAPDRDDFSARDDFPAHDPQHGDPRHGDVWHDDLGHDGLWHEDADGARVYTLEVAADTDGQRIDRVLTTALAALSRSRIQALIEAGRVRADGRTIAEPKTRVKAGQRLEVTVPPAAPDRKSVV